MYYLYLIMINFKFAEKVYIFKLDTWDISMKNIKSKKIIRNSNFARHCLRTNCNINFDIIIDLKIWNT